MLTVDYDLLDVRPGHWVLDAGCGAGRHSFEAFFRGSSICAMDYDIGEVKKVVFALHNACEKDPDHKGRWNCMRGDAINLAFADNSFDRIICSEVMEHLHEDIRVMDELFRIVKPCGKIAVTVPTIFTEAPYGWLSPLYFANPGGHVRKFVPSQLADKLRRSGFRVYGVGHSHALHSPYWLLRCAFGLEDDQHPAPRTYLKFLEMAMVSPFMNKVERALNWVCPKSMVLYAQKPSAEE